MPSLNGIYLDKGDMVIIDITDGVDNAYIKAKLRTKAQKDKSVQVKESFFMKLRRMECGQQRG